MASAYTLVVNIIAKKVIMDEEFASDGKDCAFSTKIMFSNLFLMVYTDVMT